MAQKLVDKNLKPITTEKVEDPTFTLQGNVKYELELGPERFAYRGQISNENNMQSVMAVKQFMEYIIVEQSKPTTQKKDKLHPERLKDIKTTKKILEHYAELIATALYEIQLEKHNAPDIKIVSNEEFLNKNLKK